MFSFWHLGFDHRYLYILIDFDREFYGAGHHKKLDEDKDIGYFPWTGSTCRVLRSAFRD